jgi:hypothetical protein
MFNNQTLDLINEIENNKINNEQLKKLINLIFHTLEKIKSKRNYLATQKPNLQKYIITEKFAPSFDPLTQTEDLLEHWFKYGFVVAKNVITDQESNLALNKINSILKLKENLPLDSNGSPILSRGFLEIYHDSFLAQIRQSIKLYIYHSILWDSPYLWTTFDRVGVKPPQGESSEGLNLHVDQNCMVHPYFKTIQGVLALEDCPVEQGSFVVVPGSVPYFNYYSQFIKKDYLGEFVNLDESSLYHYLKEYQTVIPLQKNSIVSWDSRTTHANSTNFSKDNRYVCYTSTGLAKYNKPDLIDIRKNSFITGLGQNHRESYLHASKKPRFTDENFINSIREKENLSVLGQCLYGFLDYKDL